MTRAGNEVRYICFKASCGYRGCIGSKGDHVAQDATHKAHKKLFSGKLRLLKPDEVEWLRKKFKIRRQYLELLRKGVEDKRVYFPQFDMTGRIHGYIARYYAELNKGRKCRGQKAYWKQVLPHDAGLLFPSMDVLEMVRKQRKVILVEDMPSALRIISQLHLPACCLGGTNLYDSHVTTLEVLGVRDVAIALDADAIVKAVKIKRQLSLAFPSTVVVPLVGLDPKDMSVSDLDIAFRQLT